MPTHAGPNTFGEENLVFGYDLADTVNSYVGAPTTNICTGADYSIYNSGATNSRNQTFPLPPVVGYEVVRVVADTPGTYGQSILWTATYSSTPTTTTNSVYAWLASGTYVQVGQHWHPWNYGSPKYIEKGKWVRISETYAINEGGSYSQAAMVYSTDGVAYFCMPQYELKPYLTPFIGFSQTRSATQGLLPLIGNSTIDLTNISFDSNAQMTFDGTDDYLSIGPSSQLNITNSVSIFAMVKINDTSGWDGIFGTFSGGGFIHFQLYLGGINCYAYGPDIGYDRIDAAQCYVTPGQWTEVGMTFGSNTLTLYINGVALPTRVSGNGNNISETDSVSIGRVYDSDRVLGGEIAKVSVYNFALTQEEVTQNFNAIKSRFNI